MRARWLVGIVILMLLVPPAAVHAQDETRAFPPRFAAQLQRALERAVSPQEVPGAVLLIDAPEALFFSAAGFADLAGEVPMTPERAFRIGSITKMFTAVILLQLQEEGILALDDRAIDWLPEGTPPLPNLDTITLRQLLNHTAGLYNYTDDQTLIDDYLADPQHGPSIMTILERVSQRNEALFAPGEGWAYSNTGYLLLGLVIEQATSQPVAEAYRTRIIEPLGLAHTYLAGDGPDTPALVHGYTPDPDSGTLIDTYTWDPHWAWTAGALVSTAEDLRAFVRALFAGALFRNPETLGEMLTPVTVSGDAGYGLGIGTSGGEEWGHAGGIPGYASALYYFPAHDLVVIMLFNGDASTFDPVLLNAAINNAIRLVRAP